MNWGAAFFKLSWSLEHTALKLFSIDTRNLNFENIEKAEKSFLEFKIFDPLSPWKVEYYSDTGAWTHNIYICIMLRCLVPNNVRTIMARVDQIICSISLIITNSPLRCPFYWGKEFHHYKVNILRDFYFYF